MNRVYTNGKEFYQNVNNNNVPRGSKSRCYDAIGNDSQGETVKNSAECFCVYVKKIMVKSYIDCKCQQ